ncbi:MAG: hypothetical protein KC646_12575 [Candidatus Cloacimonetes bacterium]|nr:hypothetical protein [Candidatus Cloacimonadota bacterium]
MANHHHFLVEQKVEKGLIKNKPQMNKTNLIVAGSSSAVALACLLYFYSTPLFIPFLFTFLACDVFLIGTVINGNKAPKVSPVVIQRIKLVIKNFEQYPKMSFEQIKSAIDMNENTLLETIRYMIQAEILMEELDMESNTWSYTISSDYLLEMDQANISMDINSRIG